MALLESNGQRPMDRQVDIGDYERWLGRVDFVDRRAKVIVQIDSTRFHRALIDHERDAAQTAALIAAGWTVLRYDEFDVWHRPSDMLAEVRHHRMVGYEARRAA